MKNTKYVLALLGILLLAGVTNVRADSDNFILTDGASTMTWTLPSSPLPSIVGPHFFNMNGVTVLENGITPVSANITLYDQTADGGISACTSSPTCIDLNFFNFYEFLAFSGTTAAPKFIPGTYTEPATEDDASFCSSGVTECDNGNGIGDTWALSTSNDANLTLTIAPVPEPFSLLLLGAGLLCLGLVARRRIRLSH